MTTEHPITGSVCAACDPDHSARRMLTWRRARRTARLPYRPVMVDSHGALLDSPRRRELVDGHVVHLSAQKPRCWALLTRPGQVVYRPVLAAAAWGSDIDADRCPLDRLLGRLGRRLSPRPRSPDRPHRVGDTGYLFASLPEVDVMPHAPRK